jgi:hypothetical protein
MCKCESRVLGPWFSCKGPSDGVSGMHSNPRVGALLGQAVSSHDLTQTFLRAPKMKKGGEEFSASANKSLECRTEYVDRKSKHTIKSKEKQND